MADYVAATNYLQYTRAMGLAASSELEWKTSHTPSGHSCCTRIWWRLTALLVSVPLSEHFVRTLESSACESKFGVESSTPTPHQKLDTQVPRDVARR